MRIAFAEFPNGLVENKTHKLEGGVEGGAGGQADSGHDSPRVSRACPQPGRAPPRAARILWLGLVAPTTAWCCFGVPTVVVRCASSPHKLLLQWFLGTYGFEH